MRRYKVVKQPEVGQLVLANKTGLVQMFTQDDILKNALNYRHTGDLKSVKDKFTFEVSVQDIFVEDEFDIRLFPSVYWEPLVLVNNRTQYVDEASDVLITRDDLLVSFRSRYQKLDFPVILIGSSAIVSFGYVS